MLIVLLIETEHEGLDHQVGKPIGSSSKHIGDAGIHIIIIARVGGQLTSNEVWANNVEQVVPESDDLSEKRNEQLNQLYWEVHMEMSGDL